MGAFSGDSPLLYIGRACEGCETVGSLEQEAAKKLNTPNAVEIVLEGTDIVLEVPTETVLDRRRSERLQQVGMVLDAELLSTGDSLRCATGCALGAVCLQDVYHRVSQENIAFRRRNQWRTMPLADIVTTPSQRTADDEVTAFIDEVFGTQEAIVDDVVSRGVVSVSQPDGEVTEFLVRRSNIHSSDVR